MTTIEYLSSSKNISTINLLIIITIMITFFHPVVTYSNFPYGDFAWQTRKPAYRFYAPSCTDPVLFGIIFTDSICWTGSTSVFNDL